MFHEVKGKQVVLQGNVHKKSHEITGGDADEFLDCPLALVCPDFIWQLLQYSVTFIDLVLLLSIFIKFDFAVF